MENGFIIKLSLNTNKKIIVEVKMESFMDTLI